MKDQKLVDRQPREVKYRRLRPPIADFDHRAEVIRRTSATGLFTVRTLIARFIAGDDANQIKFGNVRFSHDLTQTLAHTLNTLLEPKRSMRLFQSGRNWYPEGLHGVAYERQRARLSTLL